MRQLLLLAISAVVTIFSAHPTSSDETVYIGGSGKTSVQIDLGALNIGMHPDPFVYTNSLNVTETSDPIQLKAPHINQTLETKIAATINTKIPVQKPETVLKVYTKSSGTPDQKINSEEKNLEEVNLLEFSEPLNNTTEQVSEIELTIGNSWKIPFIPDEAQLPNSSLGTLTSIAIALTQNDKFRLQLNAYAANLGGSASHARRLSLTRALAVRSFLIENGVRSTRIDVRALGNKSENSKSDRVDVFLVKR